MRIDWADLALDDIDEIRHYMVATLVKSVGNGV